MFGLFIIPILFAIVGLSCLAIPFYVSYEKKRELSSDRYYKIFGTKEDKKPNLEFENMKKRNIKILTEQGINVGKVRFVFSPSFVYDFVRDEINPKFKILLPVQGNGLFDNTRKEIIVGTDERKNRIHVNVRTYDKFDFDEMRDIINNSNRGFVFMLTNESESYHFELDTQHIRYFNLDELQPQLTLEIN